jgi:hypothetical protein
MVAAGPLLDPFDHPMAGSAVGSTHVKLRSLIHDYEGRLDVEQARQLGADLRVSWQENLVPNANMQVLKTFTRMLRRTMRSSLKIEITANFFVGLNNHLHL